MISSPVYCPRMVDRRKQLDFLIERSLAAAERHGSIVFIEGDAGSGKTRLVTEFCKTATRHGLRHVDGSCYEYAKAPFGPIIAALRALFLQDPELVPESQAARAILGRLIPELSDTPPAAPTLDASEKLHHFEVLVETLQNAADKKPTILLIEDLHWADAATNEFLVHIARSVGGTPLCIVGTYRADELGHPLRSLVAKLERESAFWRLELEPLGDDDMQSFITEAVSERVSIDPEMALAIRRGAEGNPLFAEELLRSAMAAGGHVGVRDLPSSLSEAVRERLNRLRDVERSVVVSAAAIGRHFTPELLANITSVPLKGVIHALKSAIDLQLIIEKDDNGGMEFRHAMTREAVHSELLNVEARLLHAKIAEAIETMPDASERVPELAYQWWSAGEMSKAALYNERAGDGAEAVYASQDAITCYERALEATDKDDGRRAGLWRKLAWALYRTGMGARAEGAYEHSIQSFLTSDRREEAAQTLIELAHLRWTLANMPGHEEATRRALELIGDRLDTPVWFAARVQMAWAQALGRGELEQALASLVEADRSRVDARPWDSVKFHECKALICIMQGRESAALTEANSAAATALATRDIANAVRCWGNVGIVATQCGDRELATTAFGHAVTLIDEERPTGWVVPWVLALWARAQFLYGDLEGAEKTIDRAVSAILDVPSLDAVVAWTAIPLGLALENEGMVARCADESLIEMAFQSGNTALVADITNAFSSFYVAKNRVADARALLGRALATLRSYPEPGDHDAMFAMIAELCDEAEVARARAIIKQIAKTANVKSTPAYSVLVEAWSEKRFGDADRAVALARAAADMFESLHWPLHSARALEIANRPAEAAAIYRRVGSRADVRRLEGVLSPPNKRGRRRNELSAREIEIADLVLEGKSNKEIAAQLSLSERTVESHISSIFAKLEITSRLHLGERLKASKTSAAKEHHRA